MKYLITKKISTPADGAMDLYLNVIRHFAVQNIQTNGENNTFSIAAGHLYLGEFFAEINSLAEIAGG